MDSKFTDKEKRSFLFKKHIKNHWFEYLLDIIGPLILTAVLLYICKAENFIYGIIASLAYSIIKITYNLYHYKKEYIDKSIK